MTPRIILAVEDGKRRQAYLHALASVECSVLDTLGEIPMLLRQQAYNGILIDLPLNIRSSYMEKVQIFDSIHSMPSATLNYDARNGSIKLLMTNERCGKAKNLDEFALLCATFQPKILYPCNQTGLNLNALLSAERDSEGGAPERTFAMGISGSGCFLFTAEPGRYLPQEKVRIEFVGLANRQPIYGEVSWRCDWGVAHAVPGIFVSFVSILESQHKEIQALMSVADTC